MSLNALLAQLKTVLERALQEKEKLDGSWKEARRLEEEAEKTYQQQYKQLEKIWKGDETDVQPLEKEVVRKVVRDWRAVQKATFTARSNLFYGAGGHDAERQASLWDSTLKVEQAFSSLEAALSSNTYSLEGHLLQTELEALIRTVKKSREAHTLSDTLTASLITLQRELSEHMFDATGPEDAFVDHLLLVRQACQDLTVSKQEAWRSRHAYFTAKEALRIRVMTLDFKEC